MADISKLVKVAAVILILSLAFNSFLRARDYTERTLKLDAAILDIIKEKNIDKQDLVYERQERFKSGRHSFLKIIRHYGVRSDFDTDELVAAVNKQLGRLKFNLARTVRERGSAPPEADQPLAGKEKFSIFLSFKNRILYELKLLKREYYSVSPPLKLEGRGAKIAIVLDDFGYNMNNLGALFEIGSPLTVSILPNLAYSRKIAQEAGKRNFEVILHLPLEPHSAAVNLEKGTVMVDMLPEEVNTLLTKAIDTVPGLKGISNHMGSKATESRVLMKELFEEFKKRDLYFLDNLVTDKSVCRKVASEVGLRTAVRSVFLDNETNEGYIEGQFRHTADLAARTGRAIAIGHDRSRTIKVLTKVIPQLEKAGFKFVYISELVR